MNIAILDDDITVLKLISTFLKDHQYKISLFQDRNEFFNYVCSNKVDLMITDLYMDGGLKGMETITEIRKVHRLSNLPLLAISRMNEKKYIDKIIDYGADDYLSKPLDATTLKNKLLLLYKKYIENDGYLANTPSYFKEGFIEINAKILNINENEIEILSDSFISKSGLITLRWDSISTIDLDDNVFLKVKDVDRLEDKYLLKCDLGYSAKPIFHKIKATALSHLLNEDEDIKIM